MSILPRFLRADSVVVKGRNVKKRKKPNSQTGNHKGQTATASKDVTIEVRKSKSSKGSSKEYPSSGSRFEADDAEISAKDIHGPYSEKDGRFSIRADRDVSVRFNNRRKGKSKT